MDGDCFINSCFSSMSNSTAELTNISGTNAASKKYADPKLNAVCKVMIERLRLPIDFEKSYTYRSTKKPRVFTIFSDSEEEMESKMVNLKKNKEKVPIKGTKRLLRLSDSEDEAITHKDNKRIALNDLRLQPSKMSSEFVTEKSLNTPEGLRVIRRTTSSKDEENITCLTQYLQTKIEEITLSSDEEDSEANIPPVLVPFEPDSPSDTESSASSTDCDMPSISIHSNITPPAIASQEEEKELSEAIETKEEKLKNLLASGRFKSKEKSTKPTRPRPFVSRRGKKFRQSESTNFKKKKPSTLRYKIEEDQDLTSYNNSVRLAHQKNGSSTTSGVNFQPVSTMGNKCHEPIPTYKPLIPQPGPVKAKSTATSRNDKLAADLMKSKTQSIKEKKEPPKAAWSSNYVIPRKATKTINSESKTDSSKRKHPSEDDAELLTNSASASNEITPSFKPVVNRVARGTERGTEKQPTRQPTASATANRALNSSILNLGRSRDGSYGKKTLAGGTQVFWELPNCNAIAEYNGHTLKIERVCEQASSLYTFLLYQTVGFKTECQWTSFTRQSFSICESLTTLPQASHFDSSFLIRQVTPVDPRCIHPFSVTYLPCTRSSNSTRIIFPISRNDPTVIVFGAISIFLIICAIAAIFLKKKKKKKNGRSEFDKPLMPSIFLLHSNEERHQGNIQMLKKTLQERLSLSEIDDYTDEHQWVNMAVEGISWFLSRLNQKGKCIIVIEPIIEEALESDHQSQLVENNYFFIGLQQLQTLASSPDYKRVLTVWFQNSFESTNDQLKQFGNPFQNFKLPSELDLLIQQIENLESE